MNKKGQAWIPKQMLDKAEKRIEELEEQINIAMEVLERLKGSTYDWVECDCSVHAEIAIEKIKALNRG